MQTTMGCFTCLTKTNAEYAWKCQICDALYCSRCTTSLCNGCNMIPDGRDWKWGPCGFESSIPRVIQPSIVVKTGPVRKKTKHTHNMVLMSDAWTQTVHEELGCIETFDEDMIVQEDIQSTINNQEEWTMWINNPDLLENTPDIPELVL